MRIDRTGLIRENFGVAGLAWTPCYVLLGEQPVLFESGFSCAGAWYADDILKFSNQGRPLYLFLTHVHWDHCGATAYLKKRFPGLIVAASQKAADLIRRPNARKSIAELSRNAINRVAAIPGLDQSRLILDPFEPFEIDRILKQGDRITVEPGLTIEVLETPGHTRDMLSFYIPERKILIATESCGCLDRAGQIISEFLVDYYAYLDSLARLAGLETEILCQGHHFVFEGREEVRAFFKRSRQEAQRFKNRVLELLDSLHGDMEAVIRAVKAEQYDTNPYLKQPEQAYLMNLRAQVEHLAQKYAAVKMKRPV